MSFLVVLELRGLGDTTVFSLIIISSNLYHCYYYYNYYDYYYCH
jgi:hypothetical protein